MRTFPLSLVIGILISLTNSPAPATAQPLGRGPGWILRELNLTDEQKEQLACDTPGQGREIRRAYEEERSKLNEMIRERSATDDAILAQLDKTNERQAQWNLHRIQKILRVRAVLTEEQLNRFMELQAKAHPDE